MLEKLYSPEEVLALFPGAPRIYGQFGAELLWKIIMNGILNIYSQARRELERVNRMLSVNPGVFNGFNMSSDLKSIRAESDRLARIWMTQELAAATSQAHRAEIEERHEKIWLKRRTNRASRGDEATTENVAHSLIMIFNNKMKIRFTP